MSAQAWALPKDSLGRRCRRSGPWTQHDKFEKSMKRHIQSISSSLRIFLQRQVHTDRFWKLQAESHSQDNAKSRLLPDHARWPGPPLYIALNWIPDISARSAVSFFCGDFFLGIHTSSYFAHDLIPQCLQRRQEATNSGFEVKQIATIRTIRLCWKTMRMCLCAVRATSGHGKGSFRESVKICAQVWVELRTRGTR